MKSDYFYGAPLIRSHLYQAGKINNYTVAVCVHLFGVPLGQFHNYLHDVTLGKHQSSVETEYTQCNESKL